MKPIPLPIHFKAPGRSYSQIGRKGNVALYSVYSDYVTDRSTSLPYVLLGFELICIKIKNGKERYPRPEQFGSSAWSIPKSKLCFRRVGIGSSKFRSPEFRSSTFNALPDRSRHSKVCTNLAPGETKADQTAAKAVEIATRLPLTRGVPRRTSDCESTCN